MTWQLDVFPNTRQQFEETGSLTNIVASSTGTDALSVRH